MRVSRIAAVVVCGVCLAACSSGAGSGSRSDVTGVSPLASPASTGSAAPTTRGGIGSTPSTMASVHGAITGASGACAVVGSCFGPPVTNTQSGATYAFTGVVAAGGLVSSYRQNFPDGTTELEAMAQVLRYLPADAHAGAVVAIDGATASCAIVNISSPTLSDLFPDESDADPMAGYTGTAVGVELSGTDANGFTVYEPSDVQSAKLTLGGDTSSMAC